jgi:hypothetical protein
VTIRTAAGLLGAVAVLAAGCANQVQDAGAPGAAAPAAGFMSMAEAKAIILAGKSRYWKDPGSIQDARIGPVQSCHGGLAHVVALPNQCVCVEANARNGLGGYTGAHQSVFLFADRTVVDVLDKPRSQDVCEPAQPFPELNGGYVPPAIAAASPPQAKRK